MADFSLIADLKIDGSAAVRAIDGTKVALTQKLREAEQSAGNAAGKAMSGHAEKVGHSFERSAEAVKRAIEKALHAGLAFGGASIAAYLTSGSESAIAFQLSLGRVRDAIAGVGEDITTKLHFGDKSMYEWVDILSAKLQKLDISPIEKIAVGIGKAWSYLKNDSAIAQISRFAGSLSGGASVHDALNRAALPFKSKVESEAEKATRIAREKHDADLAKLIFGTRKTGRDLNYGLDSLNGGYVNGAPVSASAGKVPEIQSFISKIDAALEKLGKEKDTPEIRKLVDELRGQKTGAEGRLQEIAKRYMDQKYAEQDHQQRVTDIYQRYSDENQEFDFAQRKPGKVSTGISIDQLPNQLAQAMSQGEADKLQREKDTFEHLKKMREIAEEQSKEDKEYHRKFDTMATSVANILQTMTGTGATPVSSF